MKISKFLIGFIVFISISFGQILVPTQVHLGKTNADSSQIINTQKSNSISEMKLQGDSSTVWLGTGQGLVMIRDSVSILAIDSLSLSDGTKKYLDDGISHQIWT